VLGECDDRAAETAAGEAGADRSGCERRVDQTVERRRRDLVVVAQARVTLGEERAERSDVVPLERVDRRTDARVFRRDVADATRISGLELATALRIA
jgi:hypothetical protein